MASHNVLSVVDTVMVGTLGTAALAAVGMSGAILFFLVAPLEGFATAVQTTVAQLHGAHDERRDGAKLAGFGLVGVLALGLGIALVLASEWLARRVLNDAAVSAIAGDYLSIRAFAVVGMGLNFVCRGYWNGVQKPGTFLKIQILIHGSHIFLNWLLIFGNFGLPRLGVHGAAIASCVSVYLGALAYMVLGARHCRFPRWDGAGTYARLLRRIWQIGIPTAAQRLLQQAGNAAIFVIVGQMGAAETAVVSVLSTYAMLGVVPSLGFGMATLSLVGEAVGQRDFPGARAHVAKVLRMALGVTAVLAIAPLLYPSIAIDPFIHDDAVRQIAWLPARITALALMVDAIALVFAHGLMGAGATVSVLGVFGVTQWLLFTPAAIVLGPMLEVGLSSIWLAYLASKLIQCIALQRLWRGDNWIKAPVPV